MIRSVDYAVRLMRQGWTLSYNWGWRLHSPRDSSRKAVHHRTALAIQDDDRTERTDDRTSRVGETWGIKRKATT